MALILLPLLFQIGNCFPIVNYYNSRSSEEVGIYGVTSDMMMALPIEIPSRTAIRKVPTHFEELGKKINDTIDQLENFDYEAPLLKLTFNSDALRLARVYYCATAFLLLVAIAISFICCYNRRQRGISTNRIASVLVYKCDSHSSRVPSVSKICESAKVHNV